MIDTSAYFTCWVCHGSGRTFDVTMIDSAVARESDGVVRCTHCNGTGLTGESGRMLSVQRPAQPASVEPVGDVPSWMFE